MTDRSLTIEGLLGTGVVGVLAALGVYGFTTGYLLESPGRLFAPSVATLGIVVAVVGTLVLLGARSKRWRQNPYW
ncbi:hypothetical protein [Natrialba aegyptia]|uniref:Uncharacterized protein n=1 Tax=Natrialba aegyptia DSM 13077 TaxID=1227491 RepID=M0BIF2_9EURY|nr:hypothetical protein [Natrialba aegyptia]ELZ10063.1 hypothetical protein C480_01992 [Natrialba aegyptia DSM 13077]